MTHISRNNFNSFIALSSSYLSASRKLADKGFSGLSLRLGGLFCPKQPPFCAVHAEVISEWLRFGGMEIASGVFAKVRLLRLVHDHQVAVQVVDPGHYQVSMNCLGKK